MKSALFVTSSRGLSDFREALRLQETFQALDSAGWRVELLVPRLDPDTEAPACAAVHVLPRAPFAGELPSRPSLRRRIIAQLMFVHGACLASRGSYDVFFGTDDGAVVARRICRLAPGRRYVAELVRPFSLVGARSAGLVGGLSRRAERDAIRHAAALVIAEADDVGRFDAPLPRPRLSVIPDPAGNDSDDEFGFGDFDAAMRRVLAYASARV